MTKMKRMMKMERILKPIIKKLRLPLKLQVVKQQLAIYPYRLLQDEIDVLEKEYRSAINAKEKEYLLSKIARKREELDNVYAEEFLNEKYLKNGFKPEYRTSINLERLAIFNETGAKVTQKQLKRINEDFKAIREENQERVNELVIQAQQHYQAWKELGSKKDYRMYKELMNTVSSLCCPIQFANKPVKRQINKGEFKCIEYNDGVVKVLLKNWNTLSSNIERYEKYKDCYLDLVQSITTTKFTDAQIRALNSFIINGKSEKRESKNLQLAVDRIVGTLNDSHQYRVEKYNEVVECNVNDVDD